MRCLNGRQIVFLIALLLGVAGAAIANQPPEVTYLWARQHPGTKIFDVAYSVSDPDGDLLAISMVLLDGDGVVVCQCTSVAGDIGANVEPGNGKRITWDAGADFDGQYGLDYSLRVVADDGVGIYIANPSFESDVPEDGGWVSSGGGSGVNNAGFITGWEIPSGWGGTFRPTSVPYPGGIPDGLNIAWLNGPQLYQILEEKYKEGTTYILQVYVGNRVDVQCAGYAVQLQAEGQILAQEAALNPAPGQFLLSTLEYSVSQDDVCIGKPIEIWLLSEGIQANFDAISLQAATR